MGAKYTDAQKNASVKYLGEKKDSIQIRTPKGTKERWREAATAAGTSLNRYIMDAVEEKLKSTPNEKSPSADHETCRWAFCCPVTLSCTRVCAPAFGGVMAF